jgi:transcriptional regulator with XRE-family HTH domain
MENTESFGSRLKRLRKQAGYSIAALATHAKLNPQTIKDIEAGRKGAGIRSLEALSGALKMTIEELRGVQDVTPESAPVKLTPRKILKMYMCIPDDVVAMAGELGPEHPVWEIVRGAL